MTVKVKDFITGDTAVSYEDGKRCYNAIIPSIKSGESVVLDFSDVNYVITAFLNPIIGDLIINFGMESMKLIEIKNANQFMIEKIKTVKDGALIKREDLDV